MKYVYRRSIKDAPPPSSTYVDIPEKTFKGRFYNLLRNFNLYKRKRCCYRNTYAFTLAEVLITLGIIGVVAALTIPALIGKYEKSVVENRLKSSYSIIANAVKFAENEYGNGFEAEYVAESWSKENSHYVFEKYFAPYIKIIKTYPDDECLTLSESYGTLSGSAMYSDYNGACYALANGTALIFFAAPRNGHLFKVLINPSKKRRIDGRDIFNFYAVNKNNSIILTTYANLLTENQLITYCKSTSARPYNSMGRANFCTEMLMRNGWKIPKNYPVKF